MAVGPQLSQDVSAKGRVKCTPLQGTEYANKVAGVYSTPRYKNLDEWFQDNFERDILGEAENVEVVRTFYTHRSTPTSDVMIWYADREFGFYETLPKRVADMHATHVTIEFPRSSGIYPRVEFYVETKDESTGMQRPMFMHELIDKVIHDDDDWKAWLPEVLMQWELVFPKGESYGVMRITGYPDSPGPSRPWVDSTFGAIYDS